MARASDSEWTRWFEEAKARDIREVALQFGAQLKRAGNEWVGPCPLCGGRDRFSVNQQKRVFNCRGAEDGGGSTIDLVMHVEGCDLITATEKINGTPRPDRSRDESATDRKSREQFHTARAADYARRAEEERIAIEKKAARDEAAVSDVLKRATPITGTHAEAYLRETRGLTPSPYLTGDLRFVEELDYWGAGDNGSGE